jgi:hypothetical protein
MSKSTATTVATETTWATNGGAVAAYQENGFQKVMIVDNPDCDICGSRDGAIVDADSDISPAHNNCTVSVVPVGSCSQREPPLIEGTPLSEGEYAEVSRESVSSLDSTEMGAVKSYSAAGYSDINGYLRGKKTLSELEFLEPKELKRSITALDGAIAKNEVNRDLILYRGFGEGAPIIDVGQAITDRGFISTTISEEQARLKAWGGMLAEIQVPAGQSALALGEASITPYEFEMLLPRGTSFRVVASRTVEEAANPLGGPPLPKVRILTLEII